MDIKAKITVSSNFGTTVIDTTQPPQPNPFADWLMKIIQPSIDIQGNASIPGIVSQDFAVPYAPYGAPTHNYTPMLIGGVVVIIILIIIWTRKA